MWLYYILYILWHFDTILWHFDTLTPVNPSMCNVQETGNAAIDVAAYPATRWMDAAPTRPWREAVSVLCVQGARLLMCAYGGCRRSGMWHLCVCMKTGKCGGRCVCFHTSQCKLHQSEGQIICFSYSFISIYKHQDALMLLLKEVFYMPLALCLSSITWRKGASTVVHTPSQTVCCIMLFQDPASIIWGEHDRLDVGCDLVFYVRRHGSREEVDANSIQPPKLPCGLKSSKVDSFKANTHTPVPVWLVGFQCFEDGGFQACRGATDIWGCNEKKTFPLVWSRVLTARASRLASAERSFMMMTDWKS